MEKTIPLWYYFSHRVSVISLPCRDANFDKVFFANYFISISGKINLLSYYLRQINKNY